MNAETALAIVKDRRDVHLVAADYSVSTRTVVRIWRGETRGSFTGIKKPTLEASSKRYPSEVETALTLRRYDELDALRAIQTHFGFKLNLPLMWGRYDAWDGIGYLATDGLIAWNCKQLCEFAQQLPTAKELPTFGADYVMNQKVGDKVEIEYPKKSCPLFVEIEPGIYVKGSHVLLAQARGFEIRKTVEDPRFVYFTKAKSYKTAGDFSSVHAAITTYKTPYA